MTFDAAGNTTAIGTKSYTYNQGGRLITASDNGTQVGQYAYAFDGHRVSKTVSGVTTLYHYAIDGTLIAETDTSGNTLKEYVWDDDGRPLAMIAGGVTTFLHPDHLGSPRFGTDSNKNIVWQWYERPFGTGPPVGSVTVNLRYPGQYFDVESGLHQNWNRSYDPASGRYLESDPIGLFGGINTYRYAENNPLLYIDIDGRCPACLPLIAIGLIANEVANSEIPIIGGGLGKAASSAAESIASCSAAQTAVKKGVVIFKGLEVRAVRDLGHLTDQTLKAMEKMGFAEKDINGKSLILHHHNQLPSGPIIEIPGVNHSISNIRQHPLGNAKGVGLSTEERASFNQWWSDYWKWRAAEELKSRGLR